MKINIFGKKRESDSKIMHTKQHPYYNHEAYPDPTAYHGLKNIIDEEEQMNKQVSDLVHVFKVICSLAGFEIIGRIQFKHRKSGKEFK